MNILVLCGDKYHPADTVRRGLKPLELQGFHFDYADNAVEWSEEKMKEYPVVILTKSNNISESDETQWMTESIEKAFKDYVEKGGTLLAIHSGLAGYGKASILRNLLGGVFTHHPEMCEVTVESVKNDGITSDFKGFIIMDEHYFIEMNDLKADIMIKTVSQHGNQPGGWVRNQGKGRVYAYTPGHNLEVWLQPESQKLISRILNLSV